MTKLPPRTTPISTINYLPSHDSRQKLPESLGSSAIAVIDKGDFPTIPSSYLKVLESACVFFKNKAFYSGLSLKDIDKRSDIARRKVAEAFRLRNITLMARKFWVHPKKFSAFISLLTPILKHSVKISGLPRPLDEEEELEEDASLVYSTVMDAICSKERLTFRDAKNKERGSYLLNLSHSIEQDGKGPTLQKYLDNYLAKKKLRATSSPKFLLMKVKAIKASTSKLHSLPSKIFLKVHNPKTNAKKLQKYHLRCIQVAPQQKQESLIFDHEENSWFQLTPDSSKAISSPFRSGYANEIANKVHLLYFEKA